MIELLLEQATGEEEVPMTKEERKLVKGIMKKVNEARFIAIFEALSKADTFKGETTKNILAAFIKVKISLLRKTVSNVLAQNTQEAAASTVSSRQNARQLPPAPGKPKSIINNITSASNLSAYGIDSSVVYNEDD